MRARCHLRNAPAGVGGRALVVKLSRKFTSPRGAVRRCVPKQLNWRVDFSIRAGGMVIARRLMGLFRSRVHASMGGPFYRSRRLAGAHVASRVHIGEVEILAWKKRI
jgi:hypothetical protein